MTGGSVNARWYDIRSAAVAIAVVCVWFGNNGYHVGADDLERIYVNVPQAGKGYLACIRFQVG